MKSVAIQENTMRFASGLIATSYAITSNDPGADSYTASGLSPM